MIWMLKKLGIILSQSHDAADLFVPKAHCRDNSTRQKPAWMTGEALRKVKEKQKAWRKFLNSKSQVDYNRYARLRNQARWYTRKAVCSFEHNIAQEVRTNPKVFWRYVKNKTSVKCPVHALECDGKEELVDDAVGKANVLNQFFSSVFTDEDLSSLPLIADRFDGALLSNIEIHRDDVLKKLCELKISKSPGPDGLHPRVLFETRFVICDALDEIFKKSFRASCLPKDWKVGHVTPLFKKGKRSNPSNYRPVSLTSIVCKICESFVRDIIVQHMVQNNLLTPDQYGFVAGRSCVSQLIDTFEDWTKSLDEGLNVDVVYTDFMKAFDKVPHQRLLLKLQSFGIGGECLKWIRSFLSNRKQRVYVEGCLSDWADIKSGLYLKEVF